MSGGFGTFARNVIAGQGRYKPDMERDRDETEDQEDSGNRPYTSREQELADWPSLMLLQEAVDLYNEGATRTSFYFLLMWARIGGSLE